MEYKGPLLKKKVADKSTSEHLFTAYRRYKKNSDLVIETTIDGVHQLGGYANYAPDQYANAYAKDLLPILIEQDPTGPLQTALVLVAKEDIRLGQEIRFDYDGGPDKSFRQQMLERGVVTQKELDSASYKERRWVTPPPPRAECHEGDCMLPEDPV